jgi:hypothetical protein
MNDEEYRAKRGVLFASIVELLDAGRFDRAFFTADYFATTDRADPEPATLRDVCRTLAILADKIRVIGTLSEPTLRSDVETLHRLGSQHRFLESCVGFRTLTMAFDKALGATDISEGASANDTDGESLMLPTTGEISMASAAELASRPGLSSTLSSSQEQSLSLDARLLQSPIYKGVAGRWNWFKEVGGFVFAWLPFLILGWMTAARPWGRGEPDAGAMAYRAARAVHAVTSWDFSQTGEYFRRSFLFPWAIVPWLLFVGTNDFSLRLFNIVAALLASVFFYFVSRQYASNGISSVAVLLGITHPYFVSNYLQNTGYDLTVLPLLFSLAVWLIVSSTSSQRHVLAILTFTLSILAKFVAVGFSLTLIYAFMVTSGMSLKRRLVFSASALILAGACVIAWDLFAMAIRQTGPLAYYLGLDLTAMGFTKGLFQSIGPHQILGAGGGIISLLRSADYWTSIQTGWPRLFLVPFLFLVGAGILVRGRKALVLAFWLVSMVAFIIGAGYGDNFAMFVLVIFPMAFFAGEAIFWGFDAIANIFRRESYLSFPRVLRALAGVAILLIIPSLLQEGIRADGAIIDPKSNSDAMVQAGRFLARKIKSGDTVLYGVQTAESHYLGWYLAQGGFTSDVGYRHLEQPGCKNPASVKSTGVRWIVISTVLEGNDDGAAFDCLRAFGLAGIFSDQYGAVMVFDVEMPPVRPSVLWRLPLEGVEPWTERVKGSVSMDNATEYEGRPALRISPRVPAAGEWYTATLRLPPTDWSRAQILSMRLKSDVPAKNFDYFGIDLALAQTEQRLRYVFTFEPSSWNLIAINLRSPAYFGRIDLTNISSLSIAMHTVSPKSFNVWVADARVLDFGR